VTEQPDSSLSTVTFIDTADVYGPHSNEELIREALHPYPDNLVLSGVLASRASRLDPVSLGRGLASRFRAACGR
jgi:aryl-alcohol dehydrogenase-like predicted oxidoreductase